MIKLTSHEGRESLESPEDDIADVPAADVTFLRVFLMTYRTFTTSADFFDLLIARYRLEAPAALEEDELKLWEDQKQKLVQIRQGFQTL